MEIPHLPRFPMAPIELAELPNGPEWGYQIKWDGVRTLARLDGKGAVELFSKKMQRSNHRYPLIVQHLQALRCGACLLDGEIVYFDGHKPHFQRGGFGSDEDALIYVLFDLLYSDGRDLRPLAFSTRFQQLSAKFPDKQPQLFVTDLYDDGVALWQWIEERQWEGIVAKRLTSPYIEGKNHRDWYKRRKQLNIAANVVGIKLREGRIASLVLQYEGRYIGHVSAGLDSATKQLLTSFMNQHAGECPFPHLTPGMMKADVIWLSVSFPVQVAALEFTPSGLLRQPRIVRFGE